MKTIGVRIIGWGLMGKTHAQALWSLPLVTGTVFLTLLHNYTMFLVVDYVLKHHWIDGQGIMVIKTLISR